MATAQRQAVAVAAGAIATRLAELPDRALPTVRRLRRHVSKEVGDWPGESVVRLARALFRDRSRAPRWFVYEIVNAHPGALRSLTVRTIKAFGRGMQSWGESDVFGCYVAGPAWRLGRLPTSEVHRWARSPNLWWRRAALVCTVALNCRARGGTGDTTRTLAVCRIVKDDREDLVVKALSWALRALVVWDPEAVQRFLVDHSDALPARVKREVANKLTTGLKNPKRPRS